MIYIWNNLKYYTVKKINNTKPKIKHKIQLKLTTVRNYYAIIKDYKQQYLIVNC